MDGHGNDAGHSDSDGEIRYAMPGLSGACAAAFVRAEAAAVLLGDTVYAVVGSGFLRARVVGCGCIPMVRTEILADGAALLTRFLVGFLALVETGDVPPFPGEGPLARVRRRTDEVDLSAMHPTWYAYCPETDYVAGYERAYEVLPGLEDVVSRVVLAGPLAVDPACRQDGVGAVRLDLIPEDADRLARLLEYAAKYVGLEDGGPV